jgi:2'-5' RNA ligase
LTPQQERLFFALELDACFRKGILNLIHELQAQDFSKDIHWTLPEKLHVTLHFLGNIEANKKDLFLPEVEKILNHAPTFALKPLKLITLSKRHPRLIAISLELSKPLANLYNDIKEPLLHSGIVLENRPYLPHITLGRTKDSKPLLPRDLESIDIHLPELKVEGVSLFKSTLGNGSVYEILRQFPLI